MNQTLPKKLRLSFITLGLSVAALVAAFVSVTVLGVWREREQTPRLAVDSLVKALRTYRQQSGRFPANFRELDARVWKRGKGVDFGADGRSLSVANYLYLYHPIDAGAATIWIIPTGPRRDEASTHFLLLSPDNLRRWKGAPLSLDEIKNLPLVPQYREMALFGMTEQSAIEFTGRK